MKASFTFTPHEGHSCQQRIRQLLLNDDFSKYIMENENVELRIELRPTAKLGEKQMMYDYYHGPLLSTAMNALEDAGYELMDKVKADYILKCQCAKATMIKNGEEEYYLEDKSKMTKDRLRKFISDCVFFLESELGVQNVPDAEAYRNAKTMGRGFKSVRNL